MSRIISLCAGVLLAAFFMIPGDTRNNKKNIPEKNISVKTPAASAIANNEPQRLSGFASKAKVYVMKKELCNRYCFFADMRLGSGKKRFFIYDLEKDTVINAGLVAHGSGSETGTETLNYSNTEGSYATSQGRYKIGEEYNGTFGLAFKLYGLDLTNSNAYKRAVVLHSHKFIPDEETWPNEICTSWGCPTVSPDFLLVLQKYIHGSEKPVLLWILE